VYSNATLKLAPQHRLWQRTGQLGATLIERFGAKLDMNRPAQFKKARVPVLKPPQTVVLEYESSLYRCIIDGLGE